MDLQQPDMGSQIICPRESRQGAAAGSPSLSLGHDRGKEEPKGERRFRAQYKTLSLATQSIQEHRLFLSILITYIICGLYLANQSVDIAALSFVIKIYHGIYFPMLFWALVVFLVGQAIYFMITTKPDRLLPVFWKYLRKKYVTAERIRVALLPLLALPFFLATFTIFKSQIPTVNPFSWDLTLSQWDLLLHGGRYPWQWLDPILGKRWITLTVNILYNVWLLVTYAILFWQLFSLRHRETRRRFLLSFLTLWILLGSAGALFFSSAGPCYFDQISEAANPYAPLMAHLYDVNQSLTLWALNSQEYLWGAYADNSILFGSGISAMPSMHVATSTLFALLGWRHSRLLGWSLTIFAVSIMIGSVYLGWHYAVDGYFSIVGTLLIWRLFGWYGKRHPLPHADS